MSLSFEKVLDLLNIIIEVGDKGFVDPQRFSDFEGGLKDDLGSRISYFQSKGRKFSFEKREYHKIEIADLNGKQFLRMLISLTNNKELMKNGNCLVFLANNEPDSSLTVFYSCWFELRGVLAEFEHEEGLFARAFDDKTCSKRQKNLELVGYDSQALETFRSTLSEQYEMYMQQRMVNLEPKYRRLFGGVLFEIAKCHVRYWKAHKHLWNFPTASLVKLALDNECSGKVQPIFNDHDLHEVITNIKEQAANNSGRLDEIYQYKADLRLKGAKTIIDRIFPPNAEGKYDGEKVKEAADEIKRFYA